MDFHRFHEIVYDAHDRLLYEKAERLQEEGRYDLIATKVPLENDKEETEADLLAVDFENNLLEVYEAKLRSTKEKSINGARKRLKTIKRFFENGDECLPDSILDRIKEAGTSIERLDKRYGPLCDVFTDSTNIEDVQIKYDTQIDGDKLEEIHTPDLLSILEG